MTFRARLTLTAMVTLAIGLGSLLVIGNVLLARRVSAEASSLLRARAEAEIAALAVGEGGVRVRETPNDTVLDRRSWVFSGGRLLERPSTVSGELDRAAVSLGRVTAAVERDGPNEERLYARPVRGPAGTPAGVVVVAVSVRSFERLQRQVLIGSVIFAALVLLAGWFAIRTALRGALEPVARMTASAEDWGAHDLDRRFALGPPTDELTGLAATLDHLLARIAASRRHEQRFAEDTAHELRTPLARMRARSELALSASGPGADEERAAALRSVLEASDELDRAIRTLLLVARRDARSEVTGVDLAAVARGFDGVEVIAPDGIPAVEGDSEIVRRALAPLVENALRHARRRVVIEITGADERVRAAVRDDGRGLDPALGERAFDPGVRGTGDSHEGAGLGLPLARRLARSCGGDVVAGPGPGGCFVLELPRAGEPSA